FSTDTGVSSRLASCFSALLAPVATNLAVTSTSSTAVCVSAACGDGVAAALAATGLVVASSASAVDTSADTGPASRIDAAAYFRNMRPPRAAKYPCNGFRQADCALQPRTRRSFCRRKQRGVVGNLLLQII